MKNGFAAPAADESEHHGCTKHKKRTILIVVVVIGIAILVSGLFYLGFAGKVETCTASPCVRTANEVRRHIDTKADYCDDFYRFSCGNFLQKTHLQDNLNGPRSVEDIRREEILVEIRNLLESQIQTEDPKALNVAKKFYRACMNETAIAQEGLKKIKEIFALTGGWPTLEGYNWKEVTFDWMEAVHKLRELGVNFDVFFRISVDRDPGISSKYVLGIYEIPYSQMEPSSQIKSILFEYMVELSIIFGASRTVAQQDAREVLRLFGELAEISKEVSRENRTEDNYERLALSELQYKYPEIQWHHFLNGILKPVEHFNYDDEVIILQPRYIQFMEHFLGTTSKRSLANLISWHTLQYLINYMPTQIVEKAYELVERINGKMMNFRTPRWKTCVVESKTRLSPVLSAAYIQHFFPEDTRYKIVTMIRIIKKQFEENLIRTEWIDSETKESILGKLHAGGEQVPSYGDLLLLLDKNKIYGQVFVNHTQYLEAILNLNLINFFRQQSKLRLGFEDEDYKDIDFLTGMEIKYHPRTNILTFPLGIFGGIYYQNDRPEYMNYGILGSIIAHEVSHIYMRAEHEDLLPGDMGSWWSSNSHGNYVEKLQCLSNQYSNFGVAGLRGKHLNKEKSHMDIMADFAALKISYDAYNNWVLENAAQPLLPGLSYSPKQLFWIATAIYHCSKNSPEELGSYSNSYNLSPQQSSVNVPLRNLKEFIFDFGCRKETQMNPVEKCEVW